MCRRDDLVERSGRNLLPEEIDANGTVWRPGSKFAVRISTLARKSVPALAPPLAVEVRMYLVDGAIQQPIDTRGGAGGIEAGSVESNSGPIELEGCSTPST